LPTRNCRYNTVRIWDTSSVRIVWVTFNRFIATSQQNYEWSVVSSNKRGGVQKALSSGLCSGLLYPEMLGATCPLMLRHISEDMYLQLNHYMRTSGLTNFSCFLWSFIRPCLQNDVNYLPVVWNSLSTIGKQIDGVK
jgi:hypothetical protein